MENQAKQKVTVQTVVNAPVEKVWNYWNAPEHVTKWNTPHESWHCPSGRNDLRVGGDFSFRMEARDGSTGFDFGGIYHEVKTNEKIAYTMSDDRTVSVTFTQVGDQTKVTETFDAENTHPVDFQRDGWQAILDNFKKHTEEN
ncbi:MAG TPA: SRPBCC family protein [Bacteroidia bacterium]|nr:SRPBCC family protein [Bacteroidia bacterium]